MADVTNVRCINCNKKLAEISLLGHAFIVASTSQIRSDMTIKCPRCSVITGIKYPTLDKIASNV